LVKKLWILSYSELEGVKMLLIVILICLIVVILFAPKKIGRRQTTYDILRATEQQKIQISKSESKELVFNAKIIYAVRKIGTVLPNEIILVNQEKQQKRIKIAGLQKKITLLDLQNIKILFLLIGIIYFGFIYFITMDTIIIYLGILGTLLLYYGPEYYIIMKGKKRQNIINHELPSILTSLAIITDAGLNLVPAIEALVAQSKGILVDEMGRALEEIQIGISQKEVFTRLSDRCQVEEVQYFVSALIQGLERGNSGLTKIIRQQADESWQKRKYEAKTLAEKASMKLFMPLLCMVFPAVSIYLIGPMIFSLITLFEII
jgi:tight adherence protein C